MTSRQCRRQRKSTVTASRLSFRRDLASPGYQLRSPVGWGISLCGGRPEGGGISQLHRDRSQVHGVIFDTSGSGLWGNNLATSNLFRCGAE